jgi:hypothetical protein
MRDYDYYWGTCSLCRERGVKHSCHSHCGFYACAKCFNAYTDEQVGT